MNPNITIYCFDADTRKKYQQELSKQVELYESKITWLDSPEQEANEKDICFYIITKKDIIVKTISIILCGNFQENIRQIINEVQLFSDYRRPIKPLESILGDVINVPNVNIALYECKTWAAISEWSSYELAEHFRYSDVDPDYWIEKDIKSGIYYYVDCCNEGCFMLKYNSNMHDFAAYNDNGKITTHFDDNKEQILETLKHVHKQNTK